MSKMLGLAVVLLVVAVAVRSEIVGVVAITLGAAVVLSRLWVRRLERGVRVRRAAPEVLPNGAEATIAVSIRNPTLLRIPWVEVRESVPFGLRLVPPQTTVITLGAGAEYVQRYTIRGARRGWYQLGPLSLTMGDVLGFTKLRLSVPATPITVYPRVLPLSSLGLPATLSFGPLVGQRTEDPARPAGVRQYVPGDDVRRLDWKSTARQQTLLVRRADPTIAPETTIALAFAHHDYAPQIVQDALERGTIVAASLAMALLERKLPVSLITNGFDPQSRQAGAAIGFGKGDGQRRVMLGLLGRISPGDRDLLPMLHAQPLPWGGTLLLVVADLTLDMLPQIVALRRRGQHLALVLVEGTRSGLALAHQQHVMAYAVDRRGQPHLERSL